MPQISKIRIVNFYYNDGNRFIPDELYDLSDDSGKALNSLFNLNNGGGKTVLVQLMMQPVKPRAMAGGRRIEDYFSRQGDHSFVLLEWTTDGSREKLLTGIAMAAAAGSSSDENRRGNSIRYYTFKTVYDGHSPYSIAALDLSYSQNGKYVPAAFEYVREKAKASRGALEYYSSDEGSRWTEELYNYGILRSEWETVIETLNKDEGGLNQYFDEAKTSDRLISKFFIPAIEQKMKNAAGRDSDGSLETMLMGYAKKISEKDNVIKEHETNKRLLTSLVELNEISDKLYAVNDELALSIGDASGFRAALMRRIAGIENEMTALLQSLEEKNRLLEHIGHEERSKTFYIAGDRYEQAKALHDEAGRTLEECRVRWEELKHNEDVLQCAKLHKIITEAEGSIEQLRRLIFEKENDSVDAERIASLKYSVLVAAQTRISELERKKKEQRSEIELQAGTLEEAEKEQERAKNHRSACEREYVLAEAEFNGLKKETDRLILKLDIDAMRLLDGFYHEEEIKPFKRKKFEEKRRAETELEELNASLKKLEERKEELPGIIADNKTKISKAAGIKKKAEEELAVYGELYEALMKVCDRYTLDCGTIFSDRLKNAIYEEYDISRAKINQISRDKEDLSEKLKAAETGCVHMLPKIMEYAMSTGISFQTGEEYLCTQRELGNLSQEDMERILGNYPELAYAILFYTETDLKRFISAGNIDWLPAVVPLLTMEQVAGIFKDIALPGVCLAAWNRDYFRDREGYCGELKSQILECGNQLERFGRHIEICEEEKKLLDKFCYDAGWRSGQERTVVDLDREIMNLETETAKLDAELSSIKPECESIRNRISECDEHLRNIINWLKDYDELSVRFMEETEGFGKMQKKSISLQNAESALKESYSKAQAAEDTLRKLQKDEELTAVSLQRTQEVASKVSNAVRTETVKGELESLFAQYTVMCENLSGDLAHLNEKLGGSLREKEDAVKELSAYHSCVPEEYTSLTFMPSLLEDIRREELEVKENMDACQKRFDSCSRDLADAGVRLETARNSLEDHGGAPLPKNEIGDDFKNRKAEAKKEITLLNDRRNDLEAERRALEKISYKADTVLEKNDGASDANPVELTATPEKQWDSIKDKLYFIRSSYMKTKDRLSVGIQDVMIEYRDIAISEIVGKLNSVKVMLDDIGIKGDRLFTVSESIGTMISSIEKINMQIETDLREIENDFNDIVTQCLGQGRRMYQDLRMIAASSRAHIFPGKPQIQMVKMELPEENEISEEASRIAIRTEIANGADEIKGLMQKNAENKEILRYAKRIVSSQRLLLRYIKQESIQVKVFKIDMNARNSAYRRWEDTLTQSSGAERMVVFFSVVLTLMNYTRSREGIVSRNSKSVLILDNPFGKITSAHLLKPMFDIAGHFNVQLICLSDINKSDVINCFDCVIKLVIRAKELSNFEIVTHDGNENIEHGYYKIMNRQMSLF